MARILICHVPKDGGIAREMGAALMGRGHFVSFDGEPDSPRAERSSRMRQFEAVVVLWTESSALNVGLTDIAREAMPINLLIPVRAEGMAPTRLPLMFRKLSMLTPRDIDGIARVVARLSTAASSLREMAEREQARRVAGETLSEPAPKAEASPARPAPRRPAPVIPRREPNASRHPVRPSAEPGPAVEPGPVVAPGEAVRVRPLLNLPEVEVEPDVAGRARASTAQTPAAAVPTVPARSPARVQAGRTHASEPPSRRRADQPSRLSTQLLTSDDLERAVEAGLLVNHIPDAMWLGAPTTVELVLDRAVLADLAQLELGRGGHGQSLETLSVSLYGSAEAFEIERQSERTQFVIAKQALASHDPETIGRWMWLVTPNAAGPQDLVIRISALLRDRHGVPAPVALPDRGFSVDIQIPEGESLVSALAGWYRS